MKTLLTLAAISALLFSGWLAIRVVKSISFRQECSGHLRRASNANTVEIAAKELERAVDYIEHNNLTTGYTSVLWRTPDEDIGYWSENIKASLQELRSIAPGTSQLEKTNVLMKLRETLTDQGEKGTSVTVPDGLAIYPHNAVFALWATLTGGFCCIVGGVVLAKES